MKTISKNHYLITTDFFRYLPSRFYVITNILLILPLFSKVLSVKEMGIFQIGIGILNLVCTIFFDWISKSVLRFYEENKLKSLLDEFFSNILVLFAFNYVLLGLIYTIWGEKLCATIHIDGLTLFSLMLIILPCIIRQFLYQMLRLLNRTLLYTLSIVIYQIIMVAVTLLLINYNINQVVSIFIAMSLAMLLIDIYIVKSISVKLKFRFVFKDRSLIKEFLKYGLPLVCSNFIIWFIFHYCQYYFFLQKDFNATGEIALSVFLTNSILCVLFSTLLFSVFPRIVKRFETGRDIGVLVTNTVQLYVIYFLPITLVFCLFSQSLIDIFSNNQYTATVFILPFFAINIFLHELGKIINIKYHLLNNNYIDTLVLLGSGILCLILTNLLGVSYGVIGASIATTVSFLSWLIINFLVNFKQLPFIDYKKMIKPILAVLLICLFAYMAVSPLGNINNTQSIKIIQILAYLIVCYIVLFEYRKTILR